MGRNLILGKGRESESFSRAFTEVVWDNCLGVFEAAPQSRTVGEEQIISETALREWFGRVLAAARNGPVLYQIWRLRPDGNQESDVAYAWYQGRAVTIEAVGRELQVKSLEHFPSLDYEPPEWEGADSFEQAYASTPLLLQAERPSEFFAHDLEKLRILLERPGEYWMSML